MYQIFAKVLEYFKRFYIFRQVFLITLLAFAFSVCLRLYWVVWAGNFAEFFYNGELMINTNDGYAFAEGARDMLAGFHQPNDLSYFGSSLSTLTFWIVKFLSIKIETAMIYMSVFFGSLVVIPIILIANEYKMPKVGFMAALLGSVANSYYNRTMAGYYDTDMLIITFGVFVIWGIIRVAQNKHATALIIAPLTILCYMWWYSSAFSLISASIILFGIYTLIFDRKSWLNYVLVALMLLAIADFNFYLKIVLIVAIYFTCVFRQNLLNLKISLIIFAFSFAVFVFGGGLNPIIFQLKFYIFRDISELSDISFKYFNVNQTIQESGIVDLSLFCERISGSVAVFIVSFVGVLLLSFKFRSFLLSFGMLFLGFLALKGGLRFTIYAVPIMALGFGYFVFFMIECLKLKNIVFKIVSYIVIVFLALYPMIVHIYDYKISTVFEEKEVKILDELKSIAAREDYVLAWWDYGYPIRYYSDVKTLIDGGKHLGRDNFAVSFALGKDELSSAHMARLEVEYTQRNFNEKFGVNLNQMMKDMNFASVGEFLSALGQNGMNMPQKSREIYYYLPDRMISIFPTILQFYRLDLNSGKRWADPLFFATNYIEQKENEIVLARSISITNDMKNIKIGKSALAVNSFFQTKYNEQGKLEVSEYVLDENAQIYVIFMRDKERFLVLDKEMFNSTFVQLFVLERYDEKLFEPVILNDIAKIYRLKI